MKKVCDRASDKKLELMSQAAVMAGPDRSPDSLAAYSGRIKRRLYSLWRRGDLSGGRAAAKALCHGGGSGGAA